MIRSSNKGLLGLLLLVGAVGACGSDDRPTSPGIEPEIVNDVDAFQFQTTALQNHTGTLRYSWTNTGTMANIDQSCSFTGGEATLTLLDASGESTYVRSLADGGSYASAAGADGDWTVEVRMVGTSGTLNFRVEKRTP